MFIMALSAYYMLRRQDVSFAKSSFRLAAVFGTVAALLTIHMGDESGYLVTRDQPTKIATMEAIWDTHEAPAPMTLFALPDEEARTNHAQIDFPWVMGLIGTRSLSTEIPGINQLEAQARERIENGVKAVTTLEALRKDPKNAETARSLHRREGRPRLRSPLKRYTEDVSAATPEMIAQAAADTIPGVAPMFWSFRLMVGCGLAMALVFVLGAVYSIKNVITEKRTLLKLTLLALPLPWLACEAGWFVAEYGRQPWTIYNILPTHLSVSSLSAGEVLGSVIGFVVLYSALLVVEMWLMIRLGRKGPSSLARAAITLNSTKLPMES